MDLRSHWPTSEERSFFNREGYLVVKNALTPQQIEDLSSAIDRCGHGKGDGFYNRLDILSLDPAFQTLLDSPPVFGKICGFLGWNIWVNHTHYNVRPPDSPHEAYPYRWHRDGGNVSADLQGEMPLTAIKVGFYLTDLSTPEKGQTWLIPRSKENELSEHLGEYDLPPKEAVTINLEPGSAIMFQQRSIHSQGSPNFSNTTRKTIFVQWAFRWLYPVDTMTLGDLKDQVTDPIKRQMLGFQKERPPGKLSSQYYPVRDDLPLKDYLLKKVGLEKLAEIGPVAAQIAASYLKFDLD